MWYILEGELEREESIVLATFVPYLANTSHKLMMAEMGQDDKSPKSLQWFENESKTKA